MQERQAMSQAAPAGSLVMDSSICLFVCVPARQIVECHLCLHDEQVAYTFLSRPRPYPLHILILHTIQTSHVHLQGFENFVSIEPPCRHSSFPSARSITRPLPPSFWLLRAPVLGRSLDLISFAPLTHAGNQTRRLSIMYNAALRSCLRGALYV